MRCRLGLASVTWGVSGGGRSFCFFSRPAAHDTKMDSEKGELPMGVGGDREKDDERDLALMVKKGRGDGEGADGVQEGPGKKKKMRVKKEAPRVSWTHEMTSSLISSKSRYHARAGSAVVNGKKTHVQWKAVCEIFNKISPVPITVKQAVNKWNNVRYILFMSLVCLLFHAYSLSRLVHVGVWCEHCAAREGS